MLEQTFNTPLPLELEVVIPSGDIEIETAEGEESHITVDGDERLLAEVEIRQDGNRLVVAYRGKGKFGFSLSPFSLVFGSELRVRATVPHSAAVKVKTASADTDARRPPRLARRQRRLRRRPRPRRDHRQREPQDGQRRRRPRRGRRGHVRAHRLGRPPHRPVAGSIDAKTVSGDIRLEAVTDGDVRFTSVSGDIEIGIAQGSLVDVDAGSTSGDLSSEVPLGSEPDARRRTRRPDRRRARPHDQRRRQGLPAQG